MLPYVALWDRQGRLVSLSKLPPLVTLEQVLGRPAWHWAATDNDRDLVASAFSRCLVIGEEQHFEAAVDFGHGPMRFVVWLFPTNNLTEVGALAVAKSLPSSSELLSEREKQVLRLMADGMGSKQIALRLDIARSTVETHIGRVKAKLRVSSKEALVAFAVNYLP
jgi:DNA-binding CsgD family transcriptional regulator